MNARSLVGKESHQYHSSITITTGCDDDANSERADTDGETAGTKSGRSSRPHLDADLHFFVYTMRRRKSLCQFSAFSRAGLFGNAKGPPSEQELMSHSTLGTLPLSVCIFLWVGTGLCTGGACIRMENVSWHLSVCALICVQLLLI